MNDITYKIQRFFSIFEDFDDLSASMNFQVLKDEDNKWSAIKMWNFGKRLDKKQYFDKKFKYIDIKIFMS